MNIVQDHENKYTNYSDRPHSYAALALRLEESLPSLPIGDPMVWSKGSILFDRVLVAGSLALFDVVLAIGDDDGDADIDATFLAAQKNPIESNASAFSFVMLDFFPSLISLY